MQDGIWPYRNMRSLTVWGKEPSGMDLPWNHLEICGEEDEGGIVVMKNAMEDLGDLEKFGFPVKIK